MLPLKERTKQYALRIIRLYSALPQSTVAQTIGKQVFRSGTSIGAHYREASRARSNAEFKSKMQVAIQELDETDYWLDLLIEAELFPSPKIEPLKAETNELIAIFITCIKSASLPFPLQPSAFILYNVLVPRPACGMVQTPITSTQYPDTDGKPMADNTLQYQWIVYLVENLRRHFAGQTVFVAGDLLWYPVQVEPGQTPPRQAPDVMVVLGRPQCDRSSYKQWEEEGIAPQVVFEIISPSNTVAEMANKQTFYARHGVLEMYFYDPDSGNFWGFARETLDDETRLVMPLDLPWTSPLLKIRFEQYEQGLSVFYPDGEPFKTLQEFAEERDRALARAAQTQQHLDRALAKLKELGIDPETLNPS